MLKIEHMASVPQIIRKLLAASPALEEALNHDLLNISAYAREIQPTIEKQCRKSVSIAAISMAMRRLQTKPRKNIRQAVSNSSEVMAYQLQNIQSESDMVLLSYTNQTRERDAIEKLLPNLNPASNVIRGMWAIDLIVGQDEAEAIMQHRALQKPSRCTSGLSAISLHCAEYVSDPLLAQSVVRELDHQKISVRYLSQSTGEITLLVDQDDLVNSVAVLQKHLRLHRG